LIGGADGLFLARVARARLKCQNLPMADPRSSFVGSMISACALLLPAASPAHGADRPVALDTGQTKGASEIIFSGYQSLPNGGGVLFVEMTERVAVEVKRAGLVIEYRMVGAHVPLKNNKNPLLLRDFDSSAISAVLVPEKARGKGKAQAVKLVVTLRSDVSPTHRMVERGRGAALEIELPPAK
jgi:hypothetical protein